MSGIDFVLGLERLLNAGETAEAREQGIIGKVTQVLEPPRADQQ